MDESIKKKVDETWKEKAKNKPSEETKQTDFKIPEPSFTFFLTTIGMQVWIALGQIPNPMTNKTEENLDQAKYLIDTLGILEEKTKGNLKPEEAEILENLLYETRSVYIGKTSPSTKGGTT